jgi:hypothetical protein
MPTHHFADPEIQKARKDWIRERHRKLYGANRGLRTEPRQSETAGYGVATRALGGIRGGLDNKAVGTNPDTHTEREPTGVSTSTGKDNVKRGKNMTATKKPCDCPRWVRRASPNDTYLVNHTYECLKAQRGEKSIDAFYGKKAA